MDEGPTQHSSESDYFSNDSQEHKFKGWGRAVSTNPEFPSVDLVGDSEVSFGRKSSNTVQIKHMAVSGLHCSLICTGPGLVFVKDYSTNGTFINNEKIGKDKKLIISNGQ